jgi:hypothetical protein
MDLTCPSCRSRLALEDVNVSTDLALCRACGKSFHYSDLAGGLSTGVDLMFPPAGAWFEQLPDGFHTGATTRSWLAVFLVPFTCVWSGFSMSSIYGQQIASRHFAPFESLFGIPFLFGTCMLVSFCAMTIAGRIAVTRQADRLSIFTGVGWLGWTRNYSWSDFRSVREDVAGMASWNRQGRVIVMEGARRAAFGSLWSGDRRYFVLNALRKMLADRGQVSAITPPRFR